MLDLFVDGRVTLS